MRQSKPGFEWAASQCRQPSSGGWLDELWIGKRFQRRGIGTALVRHAEELMQNSGIACGRLSVLRANLGAIALYRRLGWTETHRFQDRANGVWNLAMSKPFAGASR